MVIVLQWSISRPRVCNETGCLSVPTLPTCQPRQGVLFRNPPTVTLTFSTSTRHQFFYLFSPKQAWGPLKKLASQHPALFTLHSNCLESWIIPIYRALVGVLILNGGLHLSKNIRLMIHLDGSLYHVFLQIVRCMCPNCKLDIYV